MNGMSLSLVWETFKKKLTTAPFSPSSQHFLSYVQKQQIVVKEGFDFFCVSDFTVMVSSISVYIIKSVTFILPGQRSYHDHKGDFSQGEASP